MSNNQTVFRFELNESLYFQSGQEIADIIGASLDPEIAIQELHDYIAIRGVIELSGDYHKVDVTHTLDDPPLEIEDIHENNFVEKVNEKSDSTATFSHRFPVEISIPSYRVNDMDEVTVQVTAFDYAIPNHYQMSLKATIEIGGINEELAQTNEEEVSTTEEANEEQKHELAEEAKEDDKQPSPMENTAELSSDDTEHREEQSFEAKDKEHKMSGAEPDELHAESSSADDTGEDRYTSGSTDSGRETEHEEAQILNDDVNVEEEMLEEQELVPNESEPEPEELEYEEPELEEPEPEEAKSEPKTEHKRSKKSQSLADFFSKNEPDEPSAHAENHDDVSEEDKEEGYQEGDGETIKTYETVSENEQSDKPIVSLSEMFEHDNEEKYAKMRLCIVQETDTIAKLAERYETTSTQIILKNRLSEDTIAEGQILYILEKAGK